MADPTRQDVLTRADPRDPSFTEVSERVEQRFRPIVERMVVREHDAVDAKVHERLDRLGRCAEGEGLRHRRPALGDAALEVKEAKVGRACELADLGRDERLRWPLRQLTCYAATEHRVAGKRKPRQEPREPSRQTNCVARIDSTG